MKNLTLISAGKIKRAINTSKKCVFMVLKIKDPDKYNAFDDCDPSHKDEMIDVFLTMMKFFRNQKD